MGLQNEDSGYLVFDIETDALPDAATYDAEPIEAPSNYTKAEAIENYIKKERQRRTDKAALNIDLAQIVAVGVKTVGFEPVCVSVENTPEADLLRAFWEYVKSGTRLIGFNIRHFDLPMLIRRSQYLGVVYPRDLDLTDRRSRRIVDLLELLSFGNIEHRRSLSFYCKRFGIASDDTTTGKDIAKLVQDGDWTAVSHHCECDVRKTVALARRLGLIGAPVAPEVF